MRVINRCFKFWPWFLKVMAVLFSVGRLYTIGVISAIGISRAAGFLALMLPLKIVLLAGSEGVPDYFKVVVNSEDKNTIIVYLAGITVLLYVSKILLDSFAAKLSQVVGQAVVVRANSFSAIGGQDELAPNVYERFCLFSANISYSLVALVVIGAIDYRLFFIFGTSFAVLYILSLFSVFSEKKNSFCKSISWLIENRLSSYLDMLVAVVFLAGFFVILYTLFLTGSANVLFALASVLLSRQMLVTLASAVRIGVSLSKQKNKVDYIIFEDSQYVREDFKNHTMLRNLFTRSKRIEIAKSICGGEAKELVTEWVDTDVGGVVVFNFSWQDGACNIWYQHRAFSTGRAFMLLNEESLFKFVERSILLAPQVFSTYKIESSTCQLTIIGSRVSHNEEWNSLLYRVLLKHWSWVPSNDLVCAYGKTHLMLSHRLNKDQIKKVQPAIDNDSEQACLDSMLEQIDVISARISKVPLIIYNPDISPSTVSITNESTNPVVTSWINWRIEPFGVGLPYQLDNNRLHDLLVAISVNRPEIANISVEDLRFVESLWRLDKKIVSAKYKAALNDMRCILDMPL